MVQTFLNEETDDTVRSARGVNQLVYRTSPIMSEEPYATLTELYAQDKVASGGSARPCMASSVFQAVV